MALRGRPKNFNPAEALEQIAGVFWEKGYAGASVEDLTLAANIKRPSLYASFGDKRTSFLAALALFRGRLQRLISEFESNPDLALGLHRFFAQSIEEYTKGASHQRGSFILTVAIEAVEQADVCDHLQAILQDLDTAFRRRFAKAIDDGELCRATDPASLAMMATATLQGLSLRARAGASVESLNEIATLAVGMMVPLVRAQVA